MKSRPMTCQDALRLLFADPSTQLALDSVYQALDKAYPSKPWKRNTIYMHLIAFSVNHPQRKDQPQTEGNCFLFWNEEKGFRKWVPERDGTWMLTENGIVRVGNEDAQEQTFAVDDPDSEDSVVAGPIYRSIERDLEDSLAQNLGMLEPDLALYRDGDVVGRQLDTGSVGMIDLLAIDKNGNFVVIELKAGKAGDKVCGEILAYIEWVRKELAGGKKVRGIIIACDFSERLRYAAKEVGELSLFRYSISLNFTEVKN